MTTDKDVAESIHRLGQLALRIADERGICVMALRKIHDYASDQIDGATESRGSDSQWTQVMEMAEKALEQCK